MDKFILGLDLGTSSIGSAIVKCDDFSRPNGILALLTRIFKEMVEDKNKVPKNKKRREARGARKRNARYKKRRTELVGILVENGFLPTETLELGNWEQIFNKMGEPFALRAKALDAPLTSHEFGRILMHLLRRRGYRSNRGAKYIELMEHQLVKDRQESEPQDEDIEESLGDENEKKEKERKKVLGGIKQLDKEMALKKYETLGQFIFETSREGLHEPRRITRLVLNGIPLYADRKMYEHEFETIWERQKDHLHLSDGLKAEIHRAIFQQLPLKLQKNLVGRCSFEIKKPRAAKALLEAQEFRMLQEINDLKVRLPNESQAIPLIPAQRQTLLNALNDHANLDDKARLSWAKVKEALGLPKRNTKFNLEETSKQGISGNRTKLQLSRAIPERWNGFEEKTKEQLIEDLLTIHDKKALFSRLINEHKREGNPWSFTTKEAYDLATLELEPGYAKHCLKVIKKILPHMREGKNYHDACQEAKYLRKDQKEIAGCGTLPLPPNVANPIVQKALFETRRVVNAILKTYGRPRLIRIELARDLKSSKKHRKQIQARDEENRKANARAEDELIKMATSHPEYGLDVNRVDHKDKEKYKLWNELKGINHLCPYCDNEHPISEAMLFSGEVEVDHIVARSLSRDDSYMNKALCHRSCNQEKGQRIPFEAWGRTSRFDVILQRLKRLEKTMPSKKIERIRMTEFDAEGFAQAQLNDTRYISVAVKNYLEQLGIPVQVTTGQATAQIRKLLNLNNILPKPPEVKPSQENGAGEACDDDGADNANEDAKAPKSMKNRSDHRHHAIDALVTALTDKALFDEITKRFKHLEKTGRWPSEKLLRYWDTLRSDATDVVMRSVVSYPPSRKISGALHKEMPFGASYYTENIHVRKLEDETIEAEPDSPDAEGYIVEEGIRKIIRSWKKTVKEGRRKAALPTLNDGATLERVKVAHRCFVKRIPTDKALKYTPHEPGEKTWVVDQGVRKILSDWKSISGNTPAIAKKEPPVMPNAKHPEKANPIKTVRVATKFKPTSIKQIGKGRQQFFELGRNHHAVIFRHKETKETDGKVVTMLEAASRLGTHRNLHFKNGDARGKNPPIFRSQDTAFDPLLWDFEMFLCQDDMVQWNTDDPEWQRKEHEKLGPPIYRVQKIDQSGTIVFRHFSVSATLDSDNWGVIRCKLRTVSFRNVTIDKSTGECRDDEHFSLKCHKLTIDPLGRYTVKR